MAKLIDSSVWIALYLEADSQHAKAVRYFEALTGKVYLPSYVASEVASVLTYKHSKAQADVFVAYALAHPGIEWIESESVIDALFFKGTKARISFVDALLLRLAKVLNAELITYDKQLARLYRAQKR